MLPSFQSTVSRGHGAVQLGRVPARQSDGRHSPLAGGREEIKPAEGKMSDVYHDLQLFPPRKQLISTMIS